MQHQYFAACPKGLEGLLRVEIESFGGVDLRETVAGVYFNGDLETAYRACLWSRLANKVLYVLGRVAADSERELYQGAAEIAWEQHISPSSTLAVDFIGTNRAIRNTQFGAVRVKDAIVDRLREHTGRRPTVERKNPDIRVNVHLNRAQAVISLDLAGGSLHRRGYRSEQGAAPMKENLAAAILLRAGWPEIAARGGALLDPMCGSGTIMIEAALMAADIAPGLWRSKFGFEHWLGHQADIWLRLREEARGRKRKGLERAAGLEIRGYDADVRVIRSAENNIVDAGLDHWLRVTRKELKDFVVPTHKKLVPGVVITNPPYGERLGEIEALTHLYQHLGGRLKAEFEGWAAAIFTSNPELCKGMAMRAQKKYKLYNGALAAELLLFDVRPEHYYREPENDRSVNREGVADAEKHLTEGAKMLGNRLRKNQKQLAKWAGQNAVSCYRLYDADMPEYAAAIDVYQSVAGEIQVHVQEYAAPKSVDEKKAAQRFAEIELAVPVALGVGREQISFKQRRRNKGKNQYEKIAAPVVDKALVVREGAAKLEVDLWRYLDTGLFLDHRPVRLKIAELIAKAKTEGRGTRFLNLFCYTATATIHAALAGAKFTVSVDMSNTYLSWAKRNLALNGLSESVNRLVQANCKEWLKQRDQQFDVIMLDPPSFSNSKRMDDVLDIQRDHVGLIDGSMQLLADDGVLIFSNNLRNFKLDSESLADYQIENFTDQSLDKDFQRNRKIHHCWLIRHRH